MAGLVSCDTIGSAIINWLESATEAERAQLCEALDCADKNAANILALLSDCNGSPIIPDTAIATCRNMEDEIREAIDAALGSIQAGHKGYATYASMVADFNNQPVGTIGEVLLDPDPTLNGTYLRTATGWVKQAGVGDVELNKINPSFVQAGPREGTVSAEPVAGLAFIKGAAVHGARLGKEYHIDYFQNQNQDVTPIGGGDGFTVWEYDAGTWDNGVSVIGRLIPVTIDRTVDKQFVHIESTSVPGLSVSFLLNPQNLPPLGTAMRFSFPQDTGYSWKISSTCYQYSDREYIDSLSSLTINRTVLFPFAPRTRNNVEPVEPVDATKQWMNAILDIRVEGARPGKLYQLTGAYAPTNPTYPSRWIFNEADIENFETENTAYRIITYTDEMPLYEANTGIQTLVLTSPREQYKDTTFYVTLDTGMLPAASLLTDGPETSGYGYIISPSRYTLQAVTEEQVRTADLQITKNAANAVTAVFNRDALHDFEVLMQPNGANGLFNFRTTTAIQRDEGTRTQLMHTNSDLVPPIAFLSTEANVDPTTGSPNYTGGNHTSDGGTGGTPTATMSSIEHAADGVVYQPGAAIKTGVTEYRVRWVNRLMAWNTKTIGRYALEQTNTAIIRKGGVEIWSKVQALENITVYTDNGLQQFSNGFDTILFYNGENVTSRAFIMDSGNLTSGPFTTTGAGVFAAALRGNEIAGNQIVWADRTFGIGDGRHIGGSAGGFRVGGINAENPAPPKIYSAMIANRQVALAPGEFYEWHMGISWSGLSGYTALDSAATAYVNNELTVMYAKVNAAQGRVRLPEGYSVNGQIVSADGYETIEPAGAYMYPIRTKTQAELLSRIEALETA